MKNIHSKSKTAKAILDSRNPQTPVAASTEHVTNLLISQKLCGSDYKQDTLKTK